MVASLIVVSAMMPAKASAQGETHTCGGVDVTLVSLSRTGPGDVTANFTILNKNNDDLGTFTYYGGANGRNTFLIDDSGTEWPKKRGDGNGNRRQALIAGVKTKYSLIFHVSTGGQDAKTFQLISWFQILPLVGIAKPDVGGWCNYKFNNVPLTPAQ